MKRWLSFPSVQIALCVAVFAVLVWRGGPFVAVIASPLLAAAIAYPVYNLVANIRHGIRENAWLPVHGQHYVFKSMTIHVLEDDDRCRWISLADMQKVAGVTASERALALTYPERCKQLGRAGLPHLRDDALIEHLSKESNPMALRFRTWVDGTVSKPGRKVRKSLGIRPEPPDKD